MLFFRETQSNPLENTTMHVHLDENQFKNFLSLSSKDVYFRLCACLDREIELVWKRATFLTAFLIAAFAGYGGLIATYIGINEPRPGTFAAISIAAIGIAIVGMALSVIWIMMAKGSKAWQKHYETVIECFSSRYVNDDISLRIFASGSYNDLPEKDYNLTGNVKDASAPKTIVPAINRNPLSSMGGNFSVSKIVVVLGQLFFLIWFAIAILHGVYIVGHGPFAKQRVTQFFGNPDGLIASCFGGIIVLLVIVVVTCFLILTSSGYLSDLKKIADKKEPLSTSKWLQKHCPFQWCCRLPFGKEENLNRSTQEKSGCVDKSKNQD